MRIGSKKNSLASINVIQNQPQAVHINVPLPEKRANSISRKIIGQSRSRDHSRGRNPLPKIQIDSDPLVRQILPHTTKASSRPQGRDSVNSACILDYNFDNGSKNRMLTSNPPVRQVGLASVNQSNNNSTIIQVNSTAKNIMS